MSIPINEPHNSNRGLPPNDSPIVRGGYLTPPGSKRAGMKFSTPDGKFAVEITAVPGRELSTTERDKLEIIFADMLTLFEVKVD